MCLLIGTFLNLIQLNSTYFILLFLFYYFYFILKYTIHLTLESTKLSKALLTEPKDAVWRSAADLKIKYGVDFRVGVVRILFFIIIIFF